MPSEFLSFSQNLRTVLKDISTTPLRSAKESEKELHKIQHDVADFFDHTQLKIHGIECPDHKKRKIRQIQHLSTDLLDKLYKRRVSNRILLKIGTRLKSLREKHPAEFDHDYPMPKHTFTSYKNRMKGQLEKIKHYLNELPLNPSLRETLINYFLFPDRKACNSAITWKNLDYHYLVSRNILYLFKNINKKPFDLALIQFFIRYNLNIPSINDYYIYQIDTCLNTDTINKNKIINQLQRLLQTKPLKNIAYNEHFKSLQRDLRDHLEIKIQEQHDDEDVSLARYLPQYTKNAEVRMLFEELQMKEGYLTRPPVLKYFHQYMSKYTLNKKGKKLSSKSYENGTRVENIQTYNYIEILLNGMLKRNDVERTLAIKKLGRPPKRTK